MGFASCGSRGQRDINQPTGPHMDPELRHPLVNPCVEQCLDVETASFNRLPQWYNVATPSPHRYSKVGTLSRHKQNAHQLGTNQPAREPASQLQLTDPAVKTGRPTGQPSFLMQALGAILSNRHSAPRGAGTDSEALKPVL